VVLGHLVAVEHPADGERDLVPAAQRPPGTTDAGLNGGELLLGGIDEHALLRARSSASSEADLMAASSTTTAHYR
jgi:hypothetical protein